MRGTTSFDVSVPRDRVFTYLANPRNVVFGSHPRPVIEQSEGTLTSGSWAVVALEQIRVRIDYVTVQPPQRLIVHVSSSGRMAMGMTGVWSYELSEHADSRTTRVAVSVDSSGGCLPGPLARLLAPLQLRAIKKGISQFA